MPQLEEVQQQSITDIEEQEAALYKSYEANATQETARLAAAREGLDELQTALDAARAAFEAKVAAFEAKKVEIGAVEAVAKRAVQKFERFRAYYMPSAAALQPEPVEAQEPASEPVEEEPVAAPVREIVAAGPAVEPVEAAEPKAKPIVVRPSKAERASSNDNNEATTEEGEPPSRELTVPERIARVMGREIWVPEKLEKALAVADPKFFASTNNPRQYLLGSLNNATIRVPTPNGDLRDRDGKIVKVRKFAAIKRGVFRVATLEDIQQAAAKFVGGPVEVLDLEADEDPTSGEDLTPEQPAEQQELTAEDTSREATQNAGAEEVKFSMTPARPVDGGAAPRTPADDLFDEHGLDVRRAVPSVPHPVP